MEEGREDAECSGCRAREGEDSGRAFQLIAWAFNSVGEVGSRWCVLNRGRCGLMLLEGPCGGCIGKRPRGRVLDVS